MTTLPCRIVWFKRDLRLADHAALATAAASGERVIPLYVVEPGLWRQPDSASRHWRFVRSSLVALDAALRGLGQPLLIRVGAAETVLTELAGLLSIRAVHSHQETGNGWTFQRDRRVAASLRTAGIPWLEHRQHGVVRRLRDRNGWAAQWEQLMAEPCCPIPEALPAWPGPPPGSGSSALHPALRGEPLPDQPAGLAAATPTERIQAGGREAGLRVLDSFLETRSRGYASGISSPGRAWTASSRLSPHLAWGSLSLREVIQASRERRAALRGTPASPERSAHLRSLRAFEERLHWHCHFIQKLESEPAIEFHNFQRACDGLREDSFDTDRYAAWVRGETGYPLVDACMRALHQGGWINFRMRALLVSFAAYHMWLHWRQPALHLARLFTDYEPGIHYCQMQMQSGTTGINTLRIYNPVKQSLDQDPDGAFIRRWVGELAAVPTPWIHQPWTLSRGQQDQLGCVIGRDYPEPIVEHVQAAREAKARFTPLRRSATANEEADRIRQRHGSRRRPAPRVRPKATPSPQRSLFENLPIPDHETQR